MFKKNLFQLVPQIERYIAGTILCNWVTLLVNVIFVITISQQLTLLIDGAALQIARLLFILAGCLVVRSFCQYQAVQFSSVCASQVKKSLRQNIYQRLLDCNFSWKRKFSQPEIVQIATEGVEQLELYFSQYLPQLFYSILATFTLFLVIAPRNFTAAIVLFVCIPLIPISMMAVRKLAKKLLTQYWGTYTDLGDTFLDNLQGLNALKIYQADQRYHEKMNQQAEKFRQITMKVLTMQLNSIIVMDLIAYGGSVCGMIIALMQYQAGAVSMTDALIIILLAADFFIPLRLLGSLFHVTMNGLAAADKITAILELPKEKEVNCNLPENATIQVKNVAFHYPEENAFALQKINCHIPASGMIAFAGQSGCGKSTLTALLCGEYQPTAGEILLGEIPLEQYGSRQRANMICRIGHDSYLFAGTIAYNLRMAVPQATDDMMIQALKQVALWEFLQEQQGLETQILAGGSNLSGGQRQRLAVARALLLNTPVYIFDEATSNIDMESEDAILDVVQQLRHHKSIILISHRLQNIVSADCIYVLQDGAVVQQGTHNALLNEDGIYRTMFEQQQVLEYAVATEETMRAENGGTAL